jgi:hypothetical protein
MTTHIYLLDQFVMATLTLESWLYCMHDHPHVNPSHNHHTQTDQTEDSGRANYNIAYRLSAIFVTV